jgi:hypothetical protein
VRKVVDVAVDRLSVTLDAPLTCDAQSIEYVPPTFLKFGTLEDL